MSSQQHLTAPEGTDQSGTPAEAEPAVVEQARIEPTEWEVRPAGIEHTRFVDPESFYLQIKRGSWQGEPTWVVTSGHPSFAFTRRGKLVRLRHDVNAKHAHHPTFEAAAALARAIADGDLPTPDYRTWRAAEARLWPAATMETPEMAETP